MELSDGFIALDSFRGDDVLACVVAFLRAGPEQDSVEKSWQGRVVSLLLRKVYLGSR